MITVVAIVVVDVISAVAVVVGIVLTKLLTDHLPILEKNLELSFLLFS